MADTATRAAVPGTVTIGLGSQRVTARVVDWTHHRVSVQPMAERRLWAHRMVPGAKVLMGWPNGNGWTSGTSRVVRWLTAYAVELEPPWSLADQQRRASPRIPCTWPVTVTTFGPTGTVVRSGRGIDVSVTGMAVQVTGEFDVGSRVALAISTPGDLTVLAVARVMGHSAGERVLRLRFEGLGHDDRRWLHRLVELLTAVRAA